MNGQNKVSGVVLAGGRARRMQQQDKGLVRFQERELVSYALAALAPLVAELMISANRNHAAYGRYGLPVLADHNADYDGPLAGMLAAMRAARTPLLLVAPCDAPLLTSADLARLPAALADAAADAAVAGDGERLHPVVLALRTGLADDLAAYLAGGGRRLQDWLRSRQLVVVDFSATPQIFANVNTPEELAALERAAAV